ncbi:MAG: hypothetical protein F6K54_31860 [Okeania sp. SIO3B5]|uniref:hypothetical protein n=1 Tax=Okeania sp. SIO3B5 TaxID=2607811 RepID=UPI0013FFBD85|nr:hypothetical protein [Okeania sp. SIO3B5]NEO57261.1 hypothetical protein [Okeania sp. SIO3B5]
MPILQIEKIMISEKQKNNSDNKIKIACILLAFLNIKVVSRSLESVIEEKHRISERIELDIYVVENYSIATESELSPYLSDLANKGIIFKYVKFLNNITNNAFDHAISTEMLDYNNYDYIIASDGDIEIPIGTIDEQLSILKNCHEVMVCSLQIDSTNWTQTHGIANKGKALSEEIANLAKEDKPYILKEAGFWFLMFRSKELEKIVTFAQSNGFRVLDITYRRIVYFIEKKLWVMTKKSIGRELNRDEVFSKSYYSVDRSAIKQQFINEGWNCQPVMYQHNKISNCLIYTKNKVLEFSPRKLMDFNPIKIEKYTYDKLDSFFGTILDEITRAGLPLRFISKIPKVKEAGVYIVRKGLGASFYLEESNTLFIQMRGEINVPPISKKSFLMVDMGNFLEPLEPLTEIENIDKFLIDACDLLKPGGFMQIVFPNSSKTLNKLGNSNFLIENNIDCTIHKVDSDEAKLPKNYSLIRIEIGNNHKDQN